MRDAAEIYARAMPLFVFVCRQNVDAFKVKQKCSRCAFVGGCFLNYDEIDALADKWQEEFLLREGGAAGNRSIGF
jgi:hypothetical protein